MKLTTLKNFKIVDLSETNGTNISVTPTIKITDENVTFNKAFCKAIGLAPYVELYVDINDSKIAFVGTDSATKTCRKFYRQKSSAKKPKSINTVYWTGQAIRHVINVAIRREPGQTIKLAGQQEEGAIIFNYGNIDQGTN
ncbi:hypothetical protein [Lactiplantibacillus plantarum]|uniref:hypothetical protein n=1 Tax=Lactiplantibacillus plantarum TaxID=1590 RepID=UPI003907F439